MTYTELSDAVKSWLNRNSFTAFETDLPTIFEIAQERIYNDPDFMLVDAMAITSVTTTTPTIPITTVAGSGPVGKQ